MLYGAYQAYADAMAPMRFGARAALSSLERLAMGTEWAMAMNGGVGRAFDMSDMLMSRFKAGLSLLADTELTHSRPDFGIETVRCGNRLATVTEKVVLKRPFGSLLKFEKDIDQAQPKVLVVAPLSGHFSTLLRNTVRTLLSDHEVYITDWTNAREVPVSDGQFGLEDYIAYLIRFLEVMGPRAHVVAVCQPCVQTLAAAAVMAEDRHPSRPLSMTLMAGPIDVRRSPTEVNKLANQNPIEWFKANLLATVPMRYKGAGRLVYPGFLQLGSFMAMNPDRHRKSHVDLFNHLAEGQTEKAQAIRAFYDEYFAVLDLTAEFYIETVDRVFQKAELAKGELTYRGRTVDPSKIRDTFLLTVEGGRDDICSVGQTSAAHDLCTGLRPHMRRQHLQADSGHYGVFSGRKWEGQIYPQIRNVILATE